MNKKEKLLRCGMYVLSVNGFHNTTIETITRGAGVPKGSFAYYFGTKSEFVRDVIVKYGLEFDAHLSSILDDDALGPLQRIRRFVDSAADWMRHNEFKRGCVVGNLGQEIALLDDSCRLVLLDALGAWAQRLGSCLRAGQVVGEVIQDLNVERAARGFWYAWEGAVLGAKLQRSIDPLYDVWEMLVKQWKQSSAS